MTFSQCGQGHVFSQDARTLLSWTHGFKPHGLKWLLILHLLWLPSSQQGGRESRKLCPLYLRELPQRPHRTFTYMLLARTWSHPAKILLRRTDLVGQLAYSDTLTFQISHIFYSSFSLFLNFLMKNFKPLQKREYNGSAPSHSFHNVHSWPVSSIPLPALLDYLEANPRHHVLSSTNALEHTSRIWETFSVEGQIVNILSFSGYIQSLLYILCCLLDCLQLLQFF